MLLLETASLAVKGSKIKDLSGRLMISPFNSAKAIFAFRVFSKISTVRKLKSGGKIGKEAI
jgi:hypothetical protein